jgi:cytochrome c553
MKVALLISFLLSSIGIAQASNLAKGKELVEKNNCAACHGANLNEPVAPAYPRLPDSTLITCITPCVPTRYRITLSLAVKMP